MIWELLGGIVFIGCFIAGGIDQVRAGSQTVWEAAIPIVLATALVVWVLT